MHVNLSLSICLHLIKHMLKSSLEKGCLPGKRSRVMLLPASESMGLANCNSEKKLFLFSN